MTLNNDTLIFKGSTPWNGKVFRGTTLIWPTVTDEYEKQYLTFEVVGSSAGTFKFEPASGFSQPLDIEFSKNDGPWVHYVSASTADKSVTNGDKVRIKGANPTYTYLPSTTGTVYYSKMDIDGTEFNMYGNIMSLIYGDVFAGKRTLTEPFCFHSLFNRSNCVDAEYLRLPATTLTQECYGGLFAGSRITTAPSLPATTLASSCYDAMFRRCESLVNAPALPATTLASGCYALMFYHCTSLVNAPALPATTLVESCYMWMFGECTSLVNAPVLPASVLEWQCYNIMFNGCSNLQYVECLATDNFNGQYALDDWLKDVSPTGTFIKHPNATWPTGVSGIPSGWTVQDAVL